MGNSVTQTVLLYVMQDSRIQEPSRILAEMRDFLFVICGCGLRASFTQSSLLLLISCDHGRRWPYHMLDKRRGVSYKQEKKGKKSQPATPLQRASDCNPLIQRRQNPPRFRKDAPVLLLCVLSGRGSWEGGSWCSGEFSRDENGDAECLCAGSH